MKHTQYPTLDHISALSQNSLELLDTNYSVKTIGGENIGGKAKNLVILSKGDLNIPSGYCLGYEHFEYYLQNKTLSTGLVDIIKAMKSILGGAIAIRSSADVEDGNEHSAAGVFNSKYVYNDEDIEQAIIDIYEEAQSIDTQSYFGDTIDAIKLCIVIQALIDKPDAAGVILSGDTDLGEHTIIEYVTGMGNKLVDAKSVGNQVIIDSVGHVIHHKKYPHNSYVLSHTDIGNLFDATIKTKKALHLKKVDMEYGIKDQILHIFQGRPITTDIIHHITHNLQQNITLPGSLNIIYPGMSLTGIIVNENDFIDIHAMDIFVKKIKSEGKNLIVVSGEPSLSLDKIMIQCDGMIMGSSGIASHGAIRAAEYKIPTIGGASTYGLSTGEIVEFNITKGEVKNHDGQNILKPLTHTLLPNEEIINEHVQKVESYIVPNDERFDNLESAKTWMQYSLSQHLDVESCECLTQILKNNMPNMYEHTQAYHESGYDSCQSRRTLSKIVSKAILIGGFFHEADILQTDPKKCQTLQDLMGSIVINKSDIPQLMYIAKHYGKNQEFLFPGITPSEKEVPSIKNLIQDIIGGKLYSSVRTISGVGGLRYDKEWNHITSFKKFLEIKIQEDDRYYPGLCLLYLLCDSDQLDIFHDMNTFSGINPNIYTKVRDFISSLQNEKEVDYKNVAILCALHLPSEKINNSNEMSLSEKLPLLQDFHSPSYELSAFKDAWECFQNEDVSNMNEAIENIQSKACKLLTFNSTIHLPWADKLAGLSHDLIGKLKNHNGEFAIRYGLGKDDKSIELYELYKNNGMLCYTLKIYNNSIFEGTPIEEFVITHGSVYYKEIQEEGLFNFIFNNFYHE